MSDDDAYETKVVITRGTGSSDRDKITTKVSAPDLETLSERVEQLQKQTEEWADDFRDIDPERSRQLGDDQQTLGGES